MSNTALEYSYRGITNEGKEKKGVVRAANKSLAITTLSAEGVFVLDLTENKNTLLSRDLSTIFERPLKVKPEVLVAFTRQLSLMLKAGVAVSDAVRALGDNSDDPRVKHMCNDLADKVTAGVPLYKAMEEYPGVFDPVFRAYLEAGDAMGDQAATTAKLARTLGKQHQMRLKVRSVTAYPKILAVITIGLVGAILTLIVPRFAELYEGLGQPLPGPTRILTTISSYLLPIRLKFQFAFPMIWKRSGDPLWLSPLNIMSPFFWGLGFWAAYKTWRQKRIDDVDLGAKLESYRFRMPLLGKMWRYNTLYRWSATVAGALEAGLNIHVALALGDRTAGSWTITKATREMIAALQSGRVVSSVLADYDHLIEPQFRAMLTAGDEVGESSVMYNFVASSLEEEIDALVAGLGAKLEVALMLLMGIVIGAIVIVLYLPILNLATAAGESYGL